MSFFYYGLISLGVVVGGLVLLLLFCLLDMAQKGDAYQDQLEFELRHQRPAPGAAQPGESGRASPSSPVGD